MNYTYTFDKKCETFEEAYQDIQNARNMFLKTLSENDSEQLKKLIRLGKLNFSSISFKGKPFSYIIKHYEKNNYQQYNPYTDYEQIYTSTLYNNFFDLVTKNYINTLFVLYEYQTQIPYKERIFNEHNFLNIFINSIVHKNETFINYLLPKVKDWQLSKPYYQELYIHAIDNDLIDLSEKIKEIATSQSIDIFSSNTILKQAIHRTMNETSSFIFDILYSKIKNSHEKGVLSKTLIKLLENKIYLSFDNDNEFRIVDHILTLIKKINGDEEKTALIFTNVLFKHSTGFGTFVVENKLREYLFTIQHYKWFEKQIPILCAKYTIQENNIDLYLYIQNFVNYQKLNKTLIVPNLKSVNKI